VNRVRTEMEKQHRFSLFHLLIVLGILSVKTAILNVGLVGAAAPLTVMPQEQFMELWRTNYPTEESSIAHFPTSDIDGRFVIMDGNHRFRALIQTGEIDPYPCDILESMHMDTTMSLPEMRILSQVKLNQTQLINLLNLNSSRA
jgi:hypothetical protein